jgi:cell division protein FtsB
MTQENELLAYVRQSLRSQWVLEQRLAVANMEIEKLKDENRRLRSSNETMQQKLRDVESAVDGSYTHPD